MTTLYLTRHGETEWNVERRVQGWLDSPLTPKGLEQARALAERLAGIPFDAIHTSPSGRALSTAEIINEQRGLPLVADPGLREIHMGDWEGLLKTEIDERFPEEAGLFWHEPHRYGRASGESFAALQDRVWQALQPLIQSPGGAYLVVTHGITLKALMTRFAGRPLSDFWAPPIMRSTCLNCVETDGLTHRVTLFGDVSHLGASAAAGTNVFTV